MIRPRVAGLAPAALAASLLLASCGTATQEASSSSSSSTTTSTVVTNTALSLGVSGPLPACLQPATAASEAGDALADLLLPSPFYEGADGSVNPNLNLLNNGRAEVVNTEPFTVVYEINPQARWSTGELLRAGDFVTAWRVRAISSLPAYAPYRLIKSVKASGGGRTVTATFSEAYADWRSLFRQLIPKSLEPVPGVDPCLPVGEQLPSATPWRVSSVSGQLVGATSNPRWWGSAPPFAGVQLHVAATQAELAAWVAGGSVDVASSLDPAAATIATAAQQRHHLRRISLTGQLIDLEMQTAGGPTESEALRRAIVASIDRQAIVTATSGASSLQYTPAASHLFAPNASAYPSGAYPSPTATPGSSPAPSRGALAAPTAQPEVAAKLLAKARYHRVGGGWAAEDGKVLSLTLAVPPEEPMATVGAAVAFQLTAAGIPTKVVPVAGVDAAGRELQAGHVDAAILLRMLTPYPTQAASWYSQGSGDFGALDYSGFSDPEVDALLDKASAELNPVYAVEDYRSVDELLWAQAPTLPLLWRPQLWTARRDLMGPEDGVFGFNTTELLNWKRTSTETVTGPSPRR